MRKTQAMLLAGALAASLLTGCGGSQNTNASTSMAEVTVGTTAEETTASEADAKTEGMVDIALSDLGILVDGEEISNDETSAVYAANDIVFYLAGQDFTYGAGSEEDEHTQEEADAHTVVHITKAGTYRLSGMLSAGQIAVDLGKEAEDDPEAVVTLVLDNADITCTVAPAIIFYHVYEPCDDSEETAVMDVDTSAAGANIVLADDSVNDVAGSYVARIYKSYTLSEDGKSVVDNKKLHKYDGAVYSKQTMNVTGEEKGNGVLNITAANEGLDSELHLTLNGGIVNIWAGNDGINTNEDNVSVTTVNGGELNIVVTGETGEGDGIDSNGWLVINGGVVTSAACGSSMDSGIDSDMGIYINGGRVMASGNMYDHIEGGNYMVFSFAEQQKGGTKYVLKDSDGNEVASWEPENDFMYLIVSNEELTEGEYTLWCGEKQLAGYASDEMQGMMPPMGGFHGENGERPEMPEGGFPDGGKPEGGKGERPEGAADGAKPEGGKGERSEGATDGAKPEGGKGERSEGATDGAKPEGGRGERPEGAADGAKPEGGKGERPEMPEGGFPGSQKPDDVELNEVFTIENGANYFLYVGEKEA